MVTEEILEILPFCQLLWQKAALKKLKVVEQIYIITDGKPYTILSLYHHVKQVIRKENSSFHNENIWHMRISEREFKK